jgi:hypothetical protein
MRRGTGRLGPPPRTLDRHHEAVLGEQRSRHAADQTVVGHDNTHAPPPLLVAIVRSKTRSPRTGWKRE